MQTQSVWLERQGHIGEDGEPGATIQGGFLGMRLTALHTLSGGQLFLVI